ncbi:AAA family ATPase [Vibrio alginolyticus]|uniref:AAA family ATPase n=1 Tax=Vibrio alginolyticus TaxID=663 RepID=UPI001BD511A7|nr:AAA family ATPase [Vibrio alginolyticus]MBS9868235.1 AAA family ATPase [Vibrio alginolyticus]HCZ9286626.1 AAA family ATPase [Vibrio alginolyticus]
MNRYVEKIYGVVPNTHKNIDIELNGRNLIITGGNGSGKTCLLREFNRKADLLIAQKKMADRESIERNVYHYEESLKNLQKGTSRYEREQRNCDSYKKQLDDINSGLNIVFTDYLSFSSNLDDRKAVLHLFEAQRKSDISSANTAKGLETEKAQVRNHNKSQRFGNNLEQHLVNLRNRRSLAITEDKNHRLADKIDHWFKEFEEDLRQLLEDNTAKLQFNSDTLKFTIFQGSKPEYTFQSLSSGYQAIFDIYADLLMRTEYFDITPKELTGIVFIDEIDAHLHVSLQRLIFPFFTKSFPNIQFIVTTHSPFVLMSSEDTIIFDLTKNEQIDEDISLYSHTAVIQGLLGTKTTSARLEEYVNEIATIVNTDNVDYERLEVLVRKLRSVENTLDNQSKAFYLMGENALLDKEQ